MQTKPHYSIQARLMVLEDLQEATKKSASFDEIKKVIEDLIAFQLEELREIAAPFDFK